MLFSDAEKGKSMVREIHDVLCSTAGPENLRSYLDFVVGMRTRLTVNNMLLVWNRMPTATYVAGREFWKGVGRKVTDGKGIEITAADFKKTQGSRVYVFFKAVEVFDLSQTVGDKFDLTDLRTYEPAELAMLLRWYAQDAGCEIGIEATGGPSEIRCFNALTCRMDRMYSGHVSPGDLWTEKRVASYLICGRLGMSFRKFENDRFQFLERYRAKASNDPQKTVIKELLVRAFHLAEVIEKEFRAYQNMGCTKTALKVARRAA